MNHLGLAFTLAVLGVNLWGLMLGVGFWLRNRWFALVSGPIVGVTAMYAVECYVGLGPSLAALGLLTTLAAAALIALSAGTWVPTRLGPRGRAGLAAWRAEFAPRGLRGCLGFAALIFLYAFTWRFLFPDVDGSSEKIADFSYICSYLHGDTLPVPDAWLHPYLSTQYYSFQHYGAALMGRLLNLPPGTTYNLAFCVLIALGGTAFAGTVALIAGRPWVRAAVVTAFVIGGMGTSGFVHLTDTRVQPWTGFRFIGSAPMDRAPVGTWLKAYASQFDRLELPGEPYAYSIYLGDFHAPLSGFYLLGLAAMGMVLWGKYQKRRYAAVVGATLTWTLLANTWMLPLQVLAVAGWLVATSRDWRRLLPAVAGGAAAVWLACWVYLSAFTAAAAGYGAALRLVPRPEHTPPLLLLIFLLPTTGLIVLGFCSGRQGVRLALLWLALLVFSEAFFVDDVYSGVYDRFNTTLKWWPWIAAGTLMTLGPIVLENARWRWARVAGTVLVLYPCCYAYDVWQPLLFAPKISIGQIAGTNYLTKDPFPRLMLDRLKVEPTGVAIERPDEAGGFTNSAVIPLFAGQRMWLGWYGHELLWREFREDIRKRHERVTAFYNAALPDAGEWLRSQGIDYVLWYRLGDTPDLWNKVNAAIGPGYLWVDLLTVDPGQPRCGFWRRVGPRPR